MALEATGLIANSQNAAQSGAQAMNSTIAFNDAESGIEYTIEWLHQQPAPPSTLVPFAPAGLANATYTTTTPSRAVVPMSVIDPISGSSNYYGTFSILVYPDQGNAIINSAYDGRMKYLIESIGTYNGVQQIVTAYVAQQSFGGYAYFTDQDTNATWTCGTNSFNGPVHTNHSSSAGRKILWFNSGSAPPLFQYAGVDAYTTSYNSVDFRENNAGTVGSPASSSDWRRVATGGQSTLHTGVSSIPMPTSSSAQMNAALGGASPPSGLLSSIIPTVMVPSAGGATSGGIYIHGNVDQMTLGTANNGQAQTIEIDQTLLATITVLSQPVNVSYAYKTYVTIDPVARTTSYYTTILTTSLLTNTVIASVGSATTTVSGMTNGMIYADGNIGSQASDSYADSAAAFANGGASHGASMTGGVCGTVADNVLDTNGNVTHASGLTIATSASNNVNIDGNLTTYTPVSSSSFTTKAGVVGLLGNAIEVIDKNASGSPITNETIDAALLAYDTIDATDIINRPAGSFTLNGGYIAETSGVFGIINSNNGSLVSGLAQHFNYDSRLAMTPPPFFPTTSSNYNVLSWQQVSAPLITPS